MRSSVSRWGNSLALRLPRAIANSLDVTEGTPVELRVEDRALLMTPTGPRFKLADLLKNYDKDVHGHGEIDQGAPVGKEVW